MVLYLWIREYLKKYSFVINTELKDGRVFIYYKDQYGEIRHKSIAYRANKEQLVALIDKIKKEINYYELRLIKAKEINKKVKSSTSAFAYTSGE